MKLLRNPIVVGLLAVAAVVVVVIQFKPMLAPMWGRMWHRAPRVSANRPAGPAKPVTPAVKPAARPLSKAAAELPVRAEAAPVAAIDVRAANDSAWRWAESPRRDPFHGYVPPSAKALGPLAKDVLKLHGVWRQTASTLAVINNKVLAEGDSIQQFRVETIDQDVVWVTGPNGREKLEFTLPTPAPPKDEDSTPEEAEPSPAEPAAGDSK